jgi:murein L,D-transpeptidase YafK
MKTIYAIIISFSLLSCAISFADQPPQPDYLLVKKSERRLYLIKNGKPIKDYKIALGNNPDGHKLQKGDSRTPEGRYVLDWRKNSQNFYKSIHISYPSVRDIQAARQRGVEPGGMIMIHGLPTGFDWTGRSIQDVDWTNGCIAVTNREIDEIWAVVKDGTPIEIMP